MLKKYRKLIKLINFPYSPVWSYSLLAGSEALKDTAIQSQSRNLELMDIWKQLNINMMTMSI